MTFGAPLYALLLLLLPAVGLLFYLRRRFHAQRLAAHSDPALRPLLQKETSEKRALVSGALVLLALGLIVLALTRPQMGGRSTLVKREGIDLLFVLDVSKSMLTEDIRPSRLKRAKLELSSLLDQLKGDRVGIVSFAGAAYVQSPLTTDYSAARLFLRNLEPKDMPVPGTAIGAALKLADTLFTTEKTAAGSRLVVLLTDGEDHGTELDEAVAKLKASKIPVFVVGIGSATGEPIPETDENGASVSYLRDKDGKTVMSRLDESRLRRIAEATGGAYVNLQAGGTFEELKRAVSNLQKQQFANALYTQYDEKYAWLLVPAFFALFAASVIGRRKRAMRRKAA